MRQKKEQKNNKRKEFWKALNMEIQEHRSSFLVYIILRVLVILCLVLQMFNQNYENVFLCVLVLILLVVPGILQVELKIELPTTLEIIILLFIFSAEILGEIQEYYIRFPGWDTILHTMNGFLMAAIGFSLVDILNRDERIKFELSPAFMSIIAFCFSMTVGVLWEFFEFGMDRILKFDMQKDTILHSFSSVLLDPTGGNKAVMLTGINDVIINGQSLGLGGYIDIGLYDTMCDLMVNFIGAVVFCAIGYFYIKYKGEGKFAKRFIPVLKDKDKDYLKIAKEEKLTNDNLSSQEENKG